MHNAITGLYIIRRHNTTLLQLPYLTVTAHNKQQHMYTVCMLAIVKIRFYSSMTDSEIISRRII